MSAGVALGQGSHPASADRNAALAYSTLFYTDMTKELTEAVDAAELNEIGLDADAAKQNEKYKAAAEQVKARQGCVRRLVEASKLSKCDFEIAYESGINALLSHLGPMRKSARLLRFDARRMLIEGKPDEAAERVAALYRMAGHIKSDEVLISSLVGVAIAGLGNSESGVLIQSGKLTASGREQIVGAIESLGRSDPYGVKGATGGERRITVQWVRSKYHGPGAGAKFVKEVTADWGMEQGSKEDLNEVEKLDDAAFAAELDRLERYFEVMQSQWDLPDAPNRLDVLASRIKQGEFGPLAKFLAPNLSKARSAQQKAEGELAEALKRLKDYVPPAPAPASKNGSNQK